VGGIPDKIQNGVNGFLARGVTPVHLADAILKALNADQQKLSRAARETVVEKFSSVSTGESYMQLFESLAND